MLGFASTWNVRAVGLAEKMKNVKVQEETKRLNDECWYLKLMPHRLLVMQIRTTAELSARVK